MGKKLQERASARQQAKAAGLPITPSMSPEKSAQFRTMMGKPAVRPNSTQPALAEQPSQTQQGMGMVPTPQAPPEGALPQAAESKPLPGMEATPILDQTGQNVFGRRPMPFRKPPKFTNKIGGGPGDGTGQGRMSGPLNPTNIF